MMQFKSKVLKFSMNGKSVEVRFPTIQEIKSLQKMQKESESEVELLEDMLLKLGMTQEVFNSLEVDHLNEIVEALVNPKKQ